MKRKDKLTLPNQNRKYNKFQNTKRKKNTYQINKKKNQRMKSQQIIIMILKILNQRKLSANQLQIR